MITRNLERLLGREHVIMGGAVGALLVLAGTYVIGLSRDVLSPMPDTAMPGMLRPWTMAELSIAFAMWSTMMVGMMTPSIAPAILTYARFSRHPVTRNAPLAPIGWFVGGYLLAWVGFAFVASAMQAALLEEGLITPMLRHLITSAILSKPVRAAAPPTNWRRRTARSLPAAMAPNLPQARP